MITWSSYVPRFTEPNELFPHLTTNGYLLALEKKTNINQNFLKKANTRKKTSTQIVLEIIIYIMPRFKFFGILCNNY